MSGASSILMVVGLGNPGTRYQDTWHNLGYLTLDAWAADRKLAFKPGRGDHYRLTYPRPDEKVTFLKPTAYMNLSGIPVAQAARRAKLSPENILIVCDDVALPLGTLRIRKSGSDGGHHGLASVLAELGSEHVPRLRIGIWTEGWKGELADYVLTPIPSTLQDDVAQILKAAAAAINCVLHEGLTRAMNRFNRDVLTESRIEKPAKARAQNNDKANAGKKT